MCNAPFCLFQTIKTVSATIDKLKTELQAYSKRPQPQVSLPASGQTTALAIAQTGSTVSTTTTPAPTAPAAHGLQPGQTTSAGATIEMQTKQNVSVDCYHGSFSGIRKTLDCRRIIIVRYWNYV